MVPLWDDVEKYCRAKQATGDNMAYAHCMLGTEVQTLSEFVTLTAFLLQHLLHKYVSMLHYMYIACCFCGCGGGGCGCSSSSSGSLVVVNLCKCII
jgi:hypothetical protein